MWAPWDVLVFQFGTFDARGGSTPPREAEALLRQALHTLAVGGLVVVLTPIPPVPGCKVPGFGRDARRWVEKTADAWARVVAEVEGYTGARLLTVTLPDEELADGAWPTPAGHARIATAIDDLLSHR